MGCFIRLRRAVLASLARPEATAGLAARGAIAPV